ncbi:MAG: AraC family transcriptional regulator [Ruminococcaceae bacterium]|nr:AraC family transcriptional regulator [Oscillospiraceae bacterium]
MKNTVYHQIENTSTYEFCTDVATQTDQRTETPHFHKNFEILAVIQGECRCEIEGKEYLMRGGDMAFILPFQIHGFCALQGAEVRRVTLHDHLIWSLASALNEKKPCDPTFRPSTIVKQFFLDQLHALFGDKANCVRRIPEQQRMMVKGCLYIIGSEFLNQAQLEPSRSADALMTDIVQYIANHYKNDISLRDIAIEKGYSYHYLSRTFNRIFNISFKSMLNQYRMEHAHFLLQDTQLPIAQIAFESGFQSIRSLDHVCREIYGRSPKEMRQNHYV